MPLFPLLWGGKNGLILAHLALLTSPRAITQYLHEVIEHFVGHLSDTA